MFFFIVISKLPFWALYLVADFIYFLVYHVLKYRKQIVFKNLRLSFPHKSEKEIRQIAKQFYKNFADITVESIKGLTISKDELLKRVQVDQTLFADYYRRNISVFIMTSHACNWEWLLQVYSITIKHPVHAGYLKVKNPFFEKLLLRIRSKFGAIMHESSTILKDLIRTKNELKVFAAVADQRPVRGENRYWTTFLNQDTPFFTGSEKITRKLDYSIVFAQMERIKRGYYKTKIIPIDDPPYSSKPFGLTQKYVEHVEEMIKKDPSAYLWSHNRWKFKRPAKEHKNLPNPL